MSGAFLVRGPRAAAAPHVGKFPDKLGVLLVDVVTASAWGGNCIYYNSKLSIGPRGCLRFSVLPPPTQQPSELTAASGSFIRKQQKWNQAEAAD